MDASGTELAKVSKNEPRAAIGGPARAPGQASVRANVCSHEAVHGWVVQLPAHRVPVRIDSVNVRL